MVKDKGSSGKKRKCLRSECLGTRIESVEEDGVEESVRPKVLELLGFTLVTV